MVNDNLVDLTITPAEAGVIAVDGRAPAGTPLLRAAQTTVVPAGSPAAGKVAAKSGTTVAGDAMNQRALVMTRGNAGYMTSRSGRESRLQMHPLALLAP